MTLSLQRILEEAVSHRHLQLKKSAVFRENNVSLSSRYRLIIDSLRDFSINQLKPKQNE